MTGTDLRNWLEAFRVTQMDFAARAGVYQPRVAEAISRGDAELSAYWTPRFEQAMAGIEAEDRERLAQVVAGPDGDNGTAQTAATAEVASA